MSVVFDILFLALGVVIVFIGAKRGFIKTAIHFMKYVLAFAAAKLFGGAFAGFLSESVFAAPVRSFVYDRFYEVYSENTAAFGTNEALNALPSFLTTESVKEGIAAAEGKGEALLNSMTDAVANPITSIFSNIAGYLGVFVIALVALWIGAIVLTKIAEKIPFIGRLNTILGAVVGLLFALTLMFAISSIVRFFFENTEFYANSVIIRGFGDSSVLRFLGFLDVGRGWLVDLFVS